MKPIPNVSEREAGKIPSTTVTNELARAVQAMAPAFTNGQAQEDFAGALLDVWIVWDEGPDGEDDTTNHQYWLRRAYVANLTNDGTERAQFTEVDRADTKYGDWILATNLSERPPNFGGTEEDGSHGLTKGQAVGPVWVESGDGGGDGTRKFVFQSGGGARVKYATADGDWTSGNSVAATPSDSTGTPIAGASGVTLFVNMPSTTDPEDVDIFSGDVIAYLETDEDEGLIINVKQGGGSSGTLAPGLAFQVKMTNAAATQVIDDWVRAHS